MEKILQVQSVNMTYVGGYTGLVDINFDLHKGEVIVFVGEKYSGKTNLARVIAGLERITSGQILVKGKEVQQIPLKERNMALLFDKSSFDKNKTLYENLSYPMTIRGFDEKTINDKITAIAKDFSIEQFLPTKVKLLPRKAVEIALFARMFVVDRDIYIVDNPFRSFSKEEKQKIYDVSEKYIKGCSMIFLTDDFEEGLTFAKSVYILDHCKIVDKADEYTRPNHIATAKCQGGKEIYATLRKINGEYYLEILKDDIIDIDKERFAKNGEPLIECNKPISDIYVDKNILACRTEDGQIDTFNYYDLASMYNITYREKE